MQEFYLIRIDRPDEVGVKDMKRYIREAIDTWKGGLHPEDPLFRLKDVLSVKRLPWNEND